MYWIFKKIILKNIIVNNKATAFQNCPRNKKSWGRHFVYYIWVYTNRQGHFVTLKSIVSETCAAKSVHLYDRGSVLFICIPFYLFIEQCNYCHCNKNALDTARSFYSKSK